MSMIVNVLKSKGLLVRASRLVTEQPYLCAAEELRTPLAARSGFAPRNRITTKKPRDAGLFLY